MRNRTGPELRGCIKPVLLTQPSQQALVCDLLQPVNGIGSAAANDPAEWKLFQQSRMKETKEHLMGFRLITLSDITAEHLACLLGHNSLT